MQVWPGQPYPLGATFDGTGTNFALFSEVAERVELCLFDDGGNETRVDLRERDAFVWHGYLPNVGPGRRYGYRVHGPYAPERGQRCNPAKLLLDPYAKAVDSDIDWDESLFPYRFENPEERNDDDSAPHMAKGVVANPFFDWANDRPPRTPYADSVIYEVHVRGFTIKHPGIPEELRGTYAGLAHPVAIDHLKTLGVTAVELMPVHQFVRDHHLVQQGLTNYWGYNTIGYLAPHHAYSSAGTLGEQVQEFKAMVKALHEAGLEVILDVVYNHTGEGNHQGPMLSFRGIDNAAYYRLVENDPRYYMDYTGTGNTLNVRHPHVLQLIMDSLRYWVTEMHVDGFRFDLAATLAREFYDVDRLSAFFDLVQQDPVVSQVKLIAEPWDVGDGGYQVGNFPPLWTEWNGKYRDTVREYWRGEPARLAEFATRLTGSSDLYESDGRRPYASVNFVTAHDGRTLHDLVAHDLNAGADAETRARQERNLLATLFLSQGIPMLLGGDEMGRTQRGDDNAYCQDNDISWFDWERARDHTVLLDFTRRLTRLRREHPVFRRRRFFQGRPLRGSDAADIGWYRPDGAVMDDDDWDSGFAKSMTVFLNGESIPEPDARGERIVDDAFFLLFNAHHESLDFVLPDGEFGDAFAVEVDTAQPVPVEDRTVKPGGEIRVEARSVVVLRRAW